MTSDQRWANIHTLIGWTVADNDSGDLVEIAHLTRHPHHCSYIAISEVKPLSESEADEYGRLNQEMHEHLTRVSKEHFSGVPAPPGVDANHWLAQCFTPFTYQNTDWYCASYECYISVRTDYVSADLLRKFQALLSGGFRDWCIQVVGSDTEEFANDHEIAVFSDQIIVPMSSAMAFGVPGTGLSPPS